MTKNLIWHKLNLEAAIHDQLIAINPSSCILDQGNWSMHNGTAWQSSFKDNGFLSGNWSESGKHFWEALQTSSYVPFVHCAS
jgi:hypothetical protein